MTKINKEQKIILKTPPNLFLLNSRNIIIIFYHKAYLIDLHNSFPIFIIIIVNINKKNDITPFI